jgi:tRNA(Arg) A34 adenosine deaminase TadA
MSLDTDITEKYLLDSIRLAMDNVRQRSGQPFGAVVARAGELVATGFNQMEALNDPTAHAEMQALRNAGRALGQSDLSGCTVYASGYPCAMCLAAMSQAGIEQVWFAYDNEDGAPFGLSAAPSYQELLRPDGERRLKFSARRVRLPDEDPYQAWHEMQADREVTP